MKTIGIVLQRQILHALRFDWGTRITEIRAKTGGERRRVVDALYVLRRNKIVRKTNDGQWLLAKTKKTRMIMNEYSRECMRRRLGTALRALAMQMRG